MYYQFLVINEPKTANAGDVLKSTHITIHAANDRAALDWVFMDSSERAARRVYVVEVHRVGGYTIPAGGFDSNNQ